MNAQQPKDVEEIRRALATKLRTMLRRFRRCPLRACRRARRCVGTHEHFPCELNAPPLRLSAERQAQALAALHRAVRARAEEHDAEA